MAAGDNTADSIIWVPGEATGKDIYGDSHALPADEDIAPAAAAVDVLHDRLVASGILPD